MREITFEGVLCQYKLSQRLRQKNSQSKLNARICSSLLNAKCMWHSPLILYATILSFMPSFSYKVLRSFSLCSGDLWGPNWLNVGLFTSVESEDHLVPSPPNSTSWFCHRKFLPFLYFRNFLFLPSSFLRQGEVLYGLLASVLSSKPTQLLEEEKMALQLHMWTFLPNTWACVFLECWLLIW